MKIRSISLLLLLYFLLSSCLHENLDGHWHLKSLDIGQEQGSLVEWQTIDIYKDSMVILGRNGVDFLGIGGGVDYFADRMSFGGECIYYDLKYSHQGDFLEIWMEEDSITYNLAAFRCDQECCNPQKDFFSYYDVPFAVDLPILKDTSGLERYQLEVGQSIIFLAGRGKDRDMILNGAESADQSLADWYNRWERNIFNDFVADRCILFASNESTISDFYDILTFLQTKEAMVFRAYREENLTSGLKIWLKEIDLNSIPSLNIQ